MDLTSPIIIFAFCLTGVKFFYMVPTLFSKDATGLDVFENSFRSTWDAFRLRNLLLCAIVTTIITLLIHDLPPF